MSSIQTIAYTPPPPAPPPATTIKQLPVAPEKFSFLILAMSLMILGICFFVAGFLFSVWCQKNPPNEAQISGSKPSVRLSHRAKSQPSQSLDANALALSSPQNHHPLKKISRGKSEPPASPGPASKAPQASQRYSVQLGAFVTHENATDLVDKLKERHINAVLEIVEDANGSPLFCVRTTQTFATYQTAQAFAQTLFHQESISAFVLPVPSTAPHPENHPEGTLS